MPPKRKIDELIELHRRVGHRAQEIFVEGFEDKRIMTRFLRSLNLDRVSVLDIDTIEVPDDQVLALGLVLGQRGRVITLAAECEGYISQEHVVCVADKDYDILLRTKYPYSLLVLTDHTAMELYAFEPSLLNSILSVSLPGFPRTGEQVLADLQVALRPSYLVRVANYSLRLSGEFPELCKFCSIDRKRNILVFNADAYLQSVFRNCLKGSWEERLKEEIKNLESICLSSAELIAHGHDFIDLLGWYLRRFPGFGHLDARTISTLMMSMVPDTHLGKQPMYVEVVRRLSPPARSAGPSDVEL